MATEIPHRDRGDSWPSAILCGDGQSALDSLDVTMLHLLGLNYSLGQMLSAYRIAIEASSMA